jgi:hypothetical protein
VIPNLLVSCKLVLQAHICASITFFSSKSPFSKNINKNHINYYIYNSWESII